MSVFPSARRVAAAYLEAPSAEGAFFDNPEKREVREFAQTEAISNIPQVVEDTEDPTRSEIEDAEDAPPTPMEIEDEPGGEELSTLNRFVVKTEEPIANIPENHSEVPKHPDMKMSRLEELWFGGISDR